jgi:hypothetical protein
MQHGVTPFAVPLENRGQSPISFRGAGVAGNRALTPIFLSKLVDEDRGDDREVGGLLGDGEPRVDPPERDDVEKEARNEERGREAALVAGVEVAEPQATLRSSVTAFAASSAESRAT